MNKVFIRYCYVHVKILSHLTSLSLVQRYIVKNLPTREEGENDARGNESKITFSFKLNELKKCECISYLMQFS